MIALQFNIELEPGGWARVCVVSGKSRVAFECSNVSDCLGDILRALARACGQAGKQEIECDTENRGVWAVTLRRKGESLELTLRHAEGTESASTTSGARVKLQHRGSWRDVVAEIARAYRRLLDEHGEQGYAALWRHAFANDAYALLSRGQ